MGIKFHGWVGFLLGKLWQTCTLPQKCSAVSADTGTKCRDLRSVESQWVRIQLHVFAPYPLEIHQSRTYGFWLLDWTHRITCSGFKRSLAPSTSCVNQMQAMQHQWFMLTSCHAFVCNDAGSVEGALHCLLNPAKKSTCLFKSAFCGSEEKLDSKFCRFFPWESAPVDGLAIDLWFWILIKWYNIKCVCLWFLTYPRKDRYRAVKICNMFPTYWHSSIKYMQL